MWSGGRGVQLHGLGVLVFNVHKKHDITCIYCSLGRRHGEDEVLRFLRGNCNSGGRLECCSFSDCWKHKFHEMRKFGQSKRMRRMVNFPVSNLLLIEYKLKIRGEGKNNCFPVENFIAC